MESDGFQRDRRHEHIKRQIKLFLQQHGDPREDEREFSWLKEDHIFHPALCDTSKSHRYFAMKAEVLVPEEPDSEPDHLWYRRRGVSQR